MLSHILLLLLASNAAKLSQADEVLNAGPLNTGANTGGNTGANQEHPAEEEINQARNGGRRPAESVRNSPDQSQVGCRELRSTKYISDGQCTSVNPIKELVCAGECLPNHLLPNWIGGGGSPGRYWSRRDAQEWRCVIDRTRNERIRLQCHDGSFRTYKITVVTSCKCKRYSREQNDSGHRDTSIRNGKQRKNQGKASPLEDLSVAQQGL